MVTGVERSGAVNCGGRVEGALQNRGVVACTSEIHSLQNDWCSGFSGSL
jgi:hypothetical protein